MRAEPDDPVEIGRILLGRNVRERRLARGLTLAQVAERTGFQKSHLSEIETGAALPSLGALQKIAAALQCTAVQLLTDIYPWGSADRPATLPPRVDGRRGRHAD